MKYLLDTHTLIWSILDSEKISNKARDIIKNKSNIIYISTVSFWEISLKIRLNKYSFSGLNILKLPQYTDKMGFIIINLETNEAISYSELPLIKGHKDPFDRMLIWQAIKQKMILISKDKMFSKYKECGLKSIW